MNLSQGSSSTTPRANKRRPLSTPNGNEKHKSKGHSAPSEKSQTSGRGPNRRNFEDSPILGSANRKLDQFGKVPSLQPGDFDREYARPLENDESDSEFARNANSEGSETESYDDTIQPNSFRPKHNVTGASTEIDYSNELEVLKQKLAAGTNISGKETTVRKDWVKINTDLHVSEFPTMVTGTLMKS
ncbi:hypothetical protein EDC01DRAFT_634872 [Geopyxis carbonaria]|nr:hypothetical protein EDC01DRAFT_634872 [Geopyxis carbonaria]